MWQARGHGKANVGVVIQITAMIMLLCTPHLPILTHALAVRVQPGHCFMDHRLCGCSPERIAARTCCCYRNMEPVETPAKHGCCDLMAKAHEPPAKAAVQPGCCDLQSHAHGQSTPGDDDNGMPSASPRLCSMPCGQDSPVISPVTSEMKYLASTWAPLPTDRSSFHNTCGSGDPYLSLSLEPPVPPPKTAITV